VREPNYIEGNDDGQLWRYIIRDHIGNWLGGFAKHIDICSTFTAELWGVLEGLCLAWRLRHRNVELDVDSTVVVKVIKDGVTTSVMVVSNASSNYSSGTMLSNGLVGLPYFLEIVK
jgi:hypothetical protein